MKIEKRRGWILIEVEENEELLNWAYRIKFVKYPKKNLCQRTEWTSSGIFIHNESWEYAKEFTRNLMNKRG